MGVDAGSVYSSIRIRLTDLDNDLKGVYARLNQLEQNITKTTIPAQKNFKDMFAAVFTGQAALALAQKGFSLLTGAIKDSIKVSTESQEMISKYDVVFGGMGDASEEAAKRFSDSFDLAGATAKEMLANTGNLLQGMGATKEESLALSEQVNVMASDLASFTNNEGGAKVASEALTKALLGEKEQMKSLGIAILDSDVKARVAKNGQENLTGTALKLAKAQATLQLITEQSKNAIGDYARTQDSASNTQKRAAERTKELQIALGTFLTPAVTVLASAWGEVAGGVAKVLGEHNKLIAAQKASDAGNATLEQRLLLLEKERAEIEKNGRMESVWNEELGRMQEVDSEEKKYYLTLQDKRIAGVKRAMQTQAMADKTKSEADKKLADDAKKQLENDEKYIAQRERVLDILKDNKTEYQQIQDEIDKINLAWQKGSKLEEDRLSAIAVLQKKQADIKQKDAETQEDADIAEMQRRRDMFEIEYDNSKKLAEEHEKANKDKEDSDKKYAEEKKAIEEYSFTASMNLLSATIELAQAVTDRKLKLLDKEMKEELDAAGVSDDTAVESAQKEYDLAVKNGNAETIADKKKALTKVKIEEDYAKRKNELEYESAMFVWQLQLAQTTASSAKAVMEAFAAGIQINPVIAGIYTALAIATGAAQVAAVAEAQPIKGYATGGIVGGSSYAGDLIPARLNSGERVLTAEQNAQMYDMMLKYMNGQSGGDQNITINSILDGQLLASNTVKYIRANKV